MPKFVAPSAKATLATPAPRPFRAPKRMKVDDEASPQPAKPPMERQQQPPQDEGVFELSEDGVSFDVSPGSSAHDSDAVEASAALVKFAASARRAGDDEQPETRLVVRSKPPMSTEGHSPSNRVALTVPRPRASLHTLMALGEATTEEPATRDERAPAAPEEERDAQETSAATVSTPSGADRAVDDAAGERDDRSGAAPRARPTCGADQVSSEPIASREAHRGGLLREYMRLRQRAAGAGGHRRPDGREGRVLAEEAASEQTLLENAPAQESPRLKPIARVVMRESFMDELEAFDAQGSTHIVAALARERVHCCESPFVSPAIDFELSEHDGVAIWFWDEHTSLSTVQLRLRDTLANLWRFTSIWIIVAVRSEWLPEFDLLSARLAAAVQSVPLPDTPCCRCEVIVRFARGGGGERSDDSETLLASIAALVRAAIAIDRPRGAPAAETATTDMLVVADELGVLKSAALGALATFPTINTVRAAKLLSACRQGGGRSPLAQLVQDGELQFPLRALGAA